MKTLDSIVSKLFDYSGMFPPEGKSFEGAIKDASEFNETLRRPHLVNANLVLSWDYFQKVSESVLIQHGFTANDFVRIAVLGQAKTISEITSEISALRSCNTSEMVKVISYEIKIEPQLLQNPEIAETFNEALKAGIDIALEPDLSKEDWKETLASVAEFIRNTGRMYALKVRGTGPTAIANDKIATVVCAVADNQLHLKATGGMHHPIIETERYNNTLGFLNLIIALLFRRALKNKMPVQQVYECLEVRDPNEFGFENSLSWKGLNLSQSVIIALKKEFRFSIGSCSLREPDEDLVRLYG